MAHDPKIPRAVKDYRVKQEAGGGGGRGEGGKLGIYVANKLFADLPWHRAVSSQSPSLSTSDFREDSSLNGNGTDENPVSLAQLNQELDSM